MRLRSNSRSRRSPDDLHVQQAEEAAAEPEADAGGLRLVAQTESRGGAFERLAEGREPSPSTGRARRTPWVLGRGSPEGLSAPWAAVVTVSPGPADVP